MKRNNLIKSEVMKIFNTTKETLRHYENLGLINPEIDKQNYRYYDHSDIRKLRQIFYLRDLEISLDEIRRLEEGDIERDEYLELLYKHHRKLEEKQERLAMVLKDTEHLIHLLKQKDFKRSFSVNSQKKREYFLVESPDFDSPPDMKTYYDLCVPYIDLGIYTERSFILIYPYKNLSHPLSIEGIQCLEIKKGRKVQMEQTTEFPEGLYLSVFYLFEDARKEDLIGLYDEIEEYMSEKKLRRVGDTVLEMEHPELSVMSRESQNVYELQIQVEKA